MCNTNLQCYAIQRIITNHTEGLYCGPFIAQLADCMRLSLKNADKFRLAYFYASGFFFLVTCRYV